MRRTSGISLMLLIFLSLCLIIFSLLSLSGAVADETLSTQAADRTVTYYAAVSEANELLSRIDTQLAANLREAENSIGESAEGHYLQLCSQIEDQIPDILWEDGTISFSVGVDKDQILQVSLDVSYPAAEEDLLYLIRSWKIVNVSDWTADNHMHLFRTEDLT